MKNIIVFAIAFFIASPVVFAQGKAGKKDTMQHTKLYTCPMHDSIAMTKPGNCPICGMTLQLSKKEQMKMDVTKNYVCPVHADAIAHGPGKCPKCGRKMNLSSKEQMKAETTKVYTCPMHPEVALDKEGNCPKCGTALVEKKQNK